LPLAALVFLITAVLSIGASRPPSVRSSDVAASEFSAERARTALERLLGDGRPHPVGTPANRAVRERLESELRKLGLVPELRRGMSCGQYGVCAVVENVIAEIPGRTRALAVALASHYDSVPAGPGAADDTVGAAVMLETARALRARGELARSVWLLFTDGEEMGLLGARVLAQDRALRERLGLVVNLEARGVAGASLLFETSTPNDGLLRAYGRAVERPVTSSVFYAAYRELPNDTDLSVFTRAGLPGVNFAFIERATRYHTPEDDVAHLSLESVQHHGDQALALVHDVVTHGIPRSEQQSVFFDLLGRRLVRVSLATGKGLAHAVVALSLVLIVALVRRSSLSWRRVGGAALAIVVGFALTLGFGFALDPALHRIHLDYQPWPASTPVLLAALYAGAFAAFAFGASLLRDAFELAEAFVAEWLLLLALSLVTAWLLPEAVFLWLVPAFVAAIGALGLLASRASVLSLPIVALGVLVSAALLWVPHAALTVHAFGFALPALAAGVAALVLLPLAPFLASLGERARRMVVLAFGSLCVVLTILGLVLPTRSVAAPQRANLGYHLDRTSGTARLLLDAPSVPPGLEGRVSFAHNTGDRYPWFGIVQPAFFRAPAERLDQPGPSLRELRRESRARDRDIELELVPGSAHALSLILGAPRGSVLEAFVDGERVDPLHVADWSLFGVVSPGASGVRVRLRVKEPGPVPVRVVEHLSGLPPRYRRLASWRDGLATQSQLGDLTIVSLDARL